MNEVPAPPAQSPASHRILAVAAAGSLASSLAASMVGVALPRIGAWASVGVTEVGWVMLAPLVAITAALLPAGRAGDVFGHRKVYVAGLAVAGVGSAASAVSPSFATLLAARAWTGLGAAMCMASSPALVSLSASPGRRGRALGLVSTAVYLGLTIGPPLGGLLETSFGFRAVFWVQSAVFVSILGASIKWMPEVEQPVEAGRGAFDATGAALLAVGLAGLLVALTRSDRWEAGRTALASGAGVLAIAAFAFRESRARAPLIDLSLFRDRTFASAAAGALLNYVAVVHATFLLPFLLEDGLGMTSRSAGVVLVTMPLVMTVVTGPSGALSDRLGSRLLSSGGMALSGVALGALALSPGPVPWIVACTGVLGLGAGVFISPNTNALMSSAPRGRQGAAAGIMALARNSGMLLGTASAAAVFDAGRAAAVASGADVAASAAVGVRVACAGGAALAAIGAVVVLARPAAPTGATPGARSSSGTR